MTHQIEYYSGDRAAGCDPFPKDAVLCNNGFAVIIDGVKYASADGDCMTDGNGVFQLVPVLSKTAAIKAARAAVSELRPFGNGYVFLTSIEGRPSFESYKTDYARALAVRSQMLIEVALLLMGDNSRVPYYGGRWTSYL